MTTLITPPRNEEPMSVIDLDPQIADACLEDRQSTETEAEPSPVFKGHDYSRQQPAWHVMVISLFTFSLYLPYWFYKTWRDLKKFGQDPETLLNPTIEKYSRCRPWARALTVVVPVFNFLYIATLFRDIALLIPDEKSSARTNSMHAGMFLALAMTAFWFLGRAEGPGFLLFNLVAVPVAVAQHWLNKYWASVETNIKT
ncbi:MAG: hypothetical protein K8F91_11930, partial [Candidatus Obscuribacterales bacterium]|nr:hypothetical protein [Candidatus Obscuribacterales bacterium]